jgi:ABC-2 type transport system permease protein
VSRALFLRTLASNRIRLLVCAVALFAWGLITPLIYATFGKELGAFIEGNPLLSQFSRFGGGDLFSLSGAMALGFIHPITLLLMGILAVGLPIGSVAGERQRGTLEVLLARPISRRAYYATLLVAGAIILALAMAAELMGNVVSAAALGVLDELDLVNIVPLWSSGWLLFVAFMAIGFAASVSFDRLGPALALTLAILVTMYVVDVVASLWPDAAWIASYSLFHYVPAKPILETGRVAPGDVGLLTGVTVLAVGYALVVFPRRDLAAPS